MTTTRNHFGLAIDGATNDLHLDADGSLAVARGAKAVAQHVRQRLMHFQGEWFLDTTAGAPWIYDILGSQYNPALSEAIVKAEILDTDGVTEITSFSVSFNREVRRLNIRDVEAGTIYDEEVRI